MSGEDKFGPYLLSFMTQAVQIKRAMLVTGAPDDGTFDCPKCGRLVTVRLVKPKNHLRAHCADRTCLSMIE